MGVRTNVDLAFQIGRDNALTNLAFDGELQQLLDTLEHVQVGTAELAASESNFSIPFGDVSVARMVYIEATGPITVTPSAVLSTGAQMDGSGGSYPTGFVGDEELVLSFDGGASITVTFESGDQTLDQVINRVNAAAALAGVTSGGIPTTVARNNGSGQLRLVSPTTGATASVEVVSADATVLSALGIAVEEETGAEGVPGQSPLQLRLPASSGSSVRAYILATLQATGLVVDNIDPTNAVNLTYAIAGDLEA